MLTVITSFFVPAPFHAASYSTRTTQTYTQTHTHTSGWALLLWCVYTECRDDLEVLDANSHHFILRPSSLPRSILLNSDVASPTAVDADVPVVIVFNLTTSLKVRFMQASMWATNIARVTMELRQYDDPRYEPTLRVFIYLDLFSSQFIFIYLFI